MRTLDAVRRAGRAARRSLRLARVVRQQALQTRFATERRRAPDWTTRHQRFTAADAHYDLDRFPRHLYVTSREWQSLHPLNGRMSVLIDDKGFLPALAGSIPDLLPPTFLSVTGDRFVRWHAGACDVRPRHLLPRAVAEHLEHHGDLVLRPIGGSGGRGVRALTGPDDLDRALRTHWRFVLTTRLTPSAFTAAVWPHALNSMRVVAHQRRTGGLRIFRINQRFGTAASGIVDNRSSGGISAVVDVATGRLGNAFQHEPHLTASRRSLATISCHPDTGVAITGTQIPEWPHIRGELDRMLEAFSFLTVAGFDAAMTPNGLRLLEINSLPAISGVQFDEPALLDEEFRALFLSLRAGQGTVG